MNIAYLKYFQTQFKSAYRQILQSSNVHSSRVCCTIHTIDTTQGQLPLDLKLESGIPV